MVARTVNHLFEDASATEHAEGPVARVIEKQTAKLPSDVFLWAAALSIGYSAFEYYRGNREQSLFVGEWAPTFLILGLYNKLVKQSGSDATDRTHRGRR